ncbi:MAG: TonB-dependent receptor [Bacteroidota bacterium]|nr:TonB-dependent receptor [Candidatus Kapabacteria bacterium]MCS7302103.1 TonB-dependent receptor [Candidatus Kapabacteria bacterium]MCX7936505.1 TonB-dependent receptor [Chlorobiota bacterium]MDW8074666.1 TonB-dependent receptor [Bacteroidota bacterium]MDW8270858.1 TonB-dependent receptor [Bacteroidota bacterium]
MQWKSGQVLVLLLIATAPGTAQHEDSVRRVFRPVVVEDTLLHEIMYALPLAQLPRRMLEQLPVVNVADAIQGLPGVFVRNYGGLGGLKTVSLRGATATQTAIILDGVRLNTATNGLVDIGQIPTALIEQISVERGSRGTLWGAGAMAGTVLLSCRQPRRGASVTGVLGAFGERALTVDVGYHHQQHQFGVIADGVYSQGNYPFLFNQFGSWQRIERRNGDAFLLNAALQWQWKLADYGNSLVVILRSSQRGAPGAVLQGAIEQTAARLDEQELFAIESFAAGDDTNPWRLRIAARWFEQLYRDSLARFRGPQGAYDRFIARDFVAVVEAPRIQLVGWYLEPKVEAYYNTLRGNLYRFGAGSFAERLQFGAAIVAGGTLLDAGSSALIAESGFRADLYSDVADALTGSVQMRWITESPIGVRLSAGTSYRPPSFNELYYQNFGSIAVRPERSYDINAGVMLQIGHLRCDLDAFTMWIRDQIIAVPRSAITWSVQNAGKVLSRGAELYIQWQQSLLSVVSSLTYQLVTYDDPTAFTYGKQVIYTPSLLGMVRTTYAVGRHLQMLATANYIGKRYSQTDNAPSSALDPVMTVDFSCRLAIEYAGLQGALTLDLLNAFDAHYAIIRNFPMPGRAWRVRLLVGWNPKR